MKYLIIFFAAFFSLAFGLTDPKPTCINGVGHLRHRYLYSVRADSSEELTYSFDTTLQGRRDELDSSFVDTIEWLVIPEGWDTLVYQCARCDSIIKEPTDTIRQISRIMYEIKPEERPGEEWDYEGTMTVGEDYIAESFYIYGYDTGNQGTCGSFSPAFPYEYNGNKFLFYTMDEGIIYLSAECEKVQIGEYEFTSPYDDGPCLGITNTGVGFCNIACTEDCAPFNPFPSPGNTVSIKIKLAEIEE
jgi:hypothetical protein